MEKEKNHAFNKDIYLLGEDSDGINYYLEDASWDCDWYWGFGYVETYTNNKKPHLARDIASHQHYDGLILKNGVCPEDFRKIFVKTPLTDDEIWKLNELMRTFYIAREYMDTLYIGGAHITKNPISESIKNNDEYLRLKNDVMPALFEEVRKILTPEEKEVEE